MRTKIVMHIDGNLVEIDQSTAMAISLSISNIEDPTTASVSFSRSIKVPMTSGNRVAMGFPEQLANTTLFNNANHRCEIAVNGTQIMSGSVTLDSVDLHGKFYSVTVISDEIDWVKAVQGNISELPAGESVIYTLADVRANAMLPHDTPSLIRFIPVDRGAFWEKDGDLFTPRTSLVLKDFHPFLNVWGVFEKMFRDYQVDCTVKSRLQQLYFPGATTDSEDLEYIEADNGFLAGIANEFTPAISSNNRLLFINSVTPGENNNLFSNDVATIHSNTSTYLQYTPKDDVTVRFKLDIQAKQKVSMCYNGGVTIRLGDKDYYDTLIVDKVCVAVNDYTNEIQLPPDYFDNFNDIEAGDNKLKRFAVTRNTVALVYLHNPANFTEINTSVFNNYGSRQGIVKVYPNKKLYIFKFSPLDGYGDISMWTVNGTRVSLIYSQKYNDEVGVFKLCDTADDYVYMLNKHSFVSQTHNVQAASINKIHTYFKSSIDRCPINSVVIDTETTLSPDFSGSISEGDSVTIQSIGGQTTQIDLIRAIKSMFNLVFYTNTRTRQMLITPASHLVGENVIDWTNKIDYSRQITVQEVGNNIGQSLTLAYQEGGEVVKEYNFRNQLVLGSNKITLSNKTKPEGTTLTNPLFKPSLTRKIDGFVYAPQLKRAKERDVIEDAEFNIDPIVVELVPNTDTTIPVANRFPIAAFSEHGARLSMQSSELGKYFTKGVQLYNGGRLITAYTVLNSFEVENIRYHNQSKQDYRSRYKILINKEPVLCDLQSVSDYNPITKLAKCTFIAGPYMVDPTIIDTPVLEVTPP